MVKIDIEMPTYCCDCPCHNGENGRCNITGETNFDKRPFDCPLKELPVTDATPTLKLLYGKREKKEERDDLTAKENIILVKNGILPPISPTKEEVASFRELVKELSCKTCASIEDVDTAKIYGYPVKELVLFATACRDAGLTVTEIRDLADIVKTVCGVVKSEFENSFKEVLDYGTEMDEE